jgi:hypothetical protein
MTYYRNYEVSKSIRGYLFADPVLNMTADERIRASTWAEMKARIDAAIEGF